MQNEERLQSEEQIWADDVLPLLQAKAMKLAELISAEVYPHGKPTFGAKSSSKGL